ncbi:MAG: hypothetical protein LBJ08_02910 [Bifidobacteriaceae bacterium]|nr:hypothetical protein [Bifidobacteriaceae bacterium]
MTLGATAFDAILGAGLLATGLYTRTAWYAANAVYYLCLTLVRGYLLEGLIAAKQPAYRGETRTRQRAGVLLAATGIAYFAVSVALHLAGRPATYTGLAPYGVAFVAFANAGLAIAGTVSVRGSGSPIRAALRITSLCDALVSMSVTQYALMSMTADPEAATSSATVGMGFATIVAVCGLVMALKKPTTKKPPEAAPKERNL